MRPSMIFAPILAALSLVSAANADIAMERPPVWSPAGGETIAFDVYRNGDSRFGTHELTFERLEDGSLQVVNDIDLTVRFGPFTPFKYRHDSIEVWRDGALVEMSGETRKEGDDLTVRAEQTDDGLAVQGTEFQGIADPSIIPSSHWNIDEVFSTEILSSETGRLLAVETENLGREVIVAGGREIEATRYRLISDITVDLWYDDAGRWVKCAFEARGQEIEYVLSAAY